MRHRIVTGCTKCTTLSVVYLRSKYLVWCSEDTSKTTIKTLFWVFPSAKRNRKRMEIVAGWCCCFCYMLMCECACSLFCFVLFCFILFGAIVFELLLIWNVDIVMIGLSFVRWWWWQWQRQRRYSGVGNDADGVQKPNRKLVYVAAFVVVASDTHGNWMSVVCVCESIVARAQTHSKFYTHSHCSTAPLPHAPDSHTSILLRLFCKCIVRMLLNNAHIMVCKVTKSRRMIQSKRFFKHFLGATCLQQILFCLSAYAVCVWARTLFALSLCFCFSHSPSDMCAPQYMWCIRYLTNIGGCALLRCACK